MTEIDYEARVARGIALLDEKMPGWADKIDLDTLAISSGTHCVTAQLSGRGNFAVGMQMLGLSEDGHCVGSYTDHGFQAEGESAEGVPPGYTQGDGYAALTPIWHREIAARQTTA